MKTCRRCKESKELELFVKRARCKDGIDSICKKCNVDEVKAYSKKPENKEKRLKYLVNYKERSKYLEFKKSEDFESRIPERKYCKTCQEEKTSNMFLIRKDSPDGLRNECRRCTNDRIKEWKSKTGKTNYTYSKKYREKNKEAYRKSQNERRAFRYKNDPCFKLAQRVRIRVYDALKKGSKSSCLKYLGCSVEEYKDYIESLFVEGMSWDNWSIRGWHIDHIVPVCNFDLSKEEDRYKAFNYKNTQPLWACDNLKKPKFIKVYNE